MKKNKTFGLGVGTTSVIMIFVILCLVIIGTLLYLITYSDTVIVDKKANYSISYQMADNVAVDTLAIIDDKLGELYSKKIAFNGNGKCRSIMDEIDNIEIDYNKNNISYKVGLGENNYLDIVIQINVNNDKYVDDKKSYTILKWKKVSNVSKIEKDNLNVWK